MVESSEPLSCLNGRAVSTIRFIIRNTMHWGKEYGWFLCNFYDLRTQRLYLCVGSTAPSLDILLFAINLIELSECSSCPKDELSDIPIQSYGTAL